MRGRLRLAAVFAATCSLTACRGADETPERASAEPLEPAPAIEKLDEPAPKFAASWPDEIKNRREQAGTAARGICSYHFDSPEGEVRAEDCEFASELTPEEQREFEDGIDQLLPADDSPPRLIARLKLDARRGTQRALLIAWGARTGQLCLSDEIVDDSGSSEGIGPRGPCARRDECAELCLEASGRGAGGDTRFVLSGVIASSGDVLAVTTSDGTTRRYPLSGPTVPRFPQWRVFMLDLGPFLFQRLELAADGVVIARREVPLALLRVRECLARWEASGAHGEESDEPLKECFGDSWVTISRGNQRSE